MRVAAFPEFRKLYAQVAHDHGQPLFKQSLPRGAYYLKVDYSECDSMLGCYVMLIPFLYPFMSFIKIILWRRFVEASHS